MSNLVQKLTPKIIVFTIEIIVVLLTVLGVFPREATLFLTGLLLFCFIFGPLEDSLWLFIASIPLFISLPITESFDSMANWRVLLLVLFFVLWFKKGISLEWRKWRIRERLRHFTVEYLIVIFFAIAAVSLLAAPSIWLGVKKMIFIGNALILFLVIRNLISYHRSLIPAVFNALKIAAGIFLGIGFLQLIVTFFVRLFDFWQYWARHVIPVFYNQSLSDLLSYSNTWFSYYSYLPATLRMFSVFPDSHSFAFLSILSLPIFLLPAYLRRKGEKKYWTPLYYFLLIVNLTAIIFSGSRGAWASAVVVLLFFFLLVLLYWSPTLRRRTDFFLPKYPDKWKRQLQFIFGTLLLFLLLFPITSAVLFLNQKIQAQGDLDLADVSFFERAKSIADFDELSAKSRLEIWRRTIDSIAARPLLGVGIGNFPRALNEDLSAAERGSSAHSLYLDIAAETGIFGLLILIAIFGCLIKDIGQFFYYTQDRYLRVWSGFLLFALIWVFGYSLFDVVLLNDKVFLFFLANFGLFYAIRAAFSFNKSPYFQQ